MSGRFFASQIISENSKKVISKNNVPYLTAEIGLNHNNDVELGKKIISEAAKSGADAVKFQSYTVDLFINKDEPQIREIYDIFKQYELNEEAHTVFQKTAENEGLDFFSTALSLDWVKKLNDIKVPFFKIASGDINNFQLLSEVLKQKKPVIISTGAASADEIEKAASFVKQSSHSEVIFLHCISVYPAEKKSLHLINISYLADKLNCLTGFSDHSTGFEAAFAAVCYGAVFIEKHFTIDKTLSGPDHSISASPDELKTLREKINLAHQMRGEIKTLALPEETNSDFFGKRSLYEKDGKLIALRPRKKDMPRDSDYLSLMLNQD